MRVIVIGAGLAGTLTALELAKDSAVEVTLLEMAGEVLPATSSSINECYRLHMGLHYAKDEYTAINCLLKSIDFAKTFPQFVSGYDDPHAPWRRGRHYVMSNSLVSVEHVKSIAAVIARRYADLVLQDSTNKVFGEPADFIRYLDATEHTNLAESIPFYDEHGVRQPDVHVSCALETGESQLEIVSFKAYLKEQIEKHPRISFLPASEVVSIEQDPRTLGYRVSSLRFTELCTHSGDAVVNCSWQNIEKLNSTAGIELADQHRVNRLKASILVQLPAELIKMNSSIFSLGPYACITIMPNGTAVLTSERTTNIASFNAGAMDDSSEQMRECVASLTLSTATGREIANKILDECASYLNPELAEKLRSARILELRLGFVKLMEHDATYTKSSIYQANSMIHERPIEGVEVHRPGYISNAGMKMIYTLHNARQVAEILMQHMHEMSMLSGEEKISWPLNTISLKRLVHVRSASALTLFSPILAEGKDLSHSSSMPSLGRPGHSSPVSFWGTCPSPLSCEDEDAGDVALYFGCASPRPDLFPHK